MSTLFKYAVILMIALQILIANALADPPEQPYSSYWFPNDLLTWSPSMDPDAAFNRGNTPLADRFIGDIQVNSNARPDEALIAALSIMYPTTSGNPSQGGYQLDVYAFNYWQYIDILVMWGGSAGEGLILSPSADVIDAAHRNGVPVYGTIFFAPTVYGGQIQWVRDFLQTSGQAFPVADKLIEIAEYYGFDGWFINQETAGGDASLAELMRDFMEYIQLNSNVRIMWYDSMTENGNISWQNALNDANDMFFQDGGTISNEMFLNFSWTAAGLTSSATHAQGLGRSPYELYAGADVQAHGYNTSVRWKKIFPEGQPHVTSLGLYCPNWCYSASTSQADFYEKANRFWVGANRDPSNTETTSNWKGLAHFVPAFSVINDLPFVTNFNTGQGHLYAVDGDIVRDGDWNNRSLQDILPTWRWIAESKGTALYPELEWSDAYFGGTCLKVSGDLSPGVSTHLKLFKTDLAVSADTELVLVYRTGTAGTPTYMMGGVAFTDNPDQYEFMDAGVSTGAGWNEMRFDLGSHAGKRIAVISLRFQADVAVPDYEIRIGRISALDGPSETPEPPSGLYVDSFQLINDQQGTLRLRWDHSPSNCRCYNIYRMNPDSSRTFLGGTPNNALFVPEINRVGNEQSTSLEVEAVGQQFTASTAASVTIDWPAMTPTPALSPTPAQTPMNLEIELTMPKKSFSGGDDCWLKLLMINPGSQRTADLYVLLSVLDEYWSYPSWISLTDGIDSETVTVVFGSNEPKELIAPFEMPTVSPFGPIQFYAAMFEPDTISVDTLISNVPVFAFYLE